jgi:hypothetical protein
MHIAALFSWKLEDMVRETARLQDEQRAVSEIRLLDREKRPSSSSADMIIASLW